MPVAATAVSVVLHGLGVVTLDLLVGGAVNLWAATTARLAASGRRSGEPDDAARRASEIRRQSG